MTRAESPGTSPQVAIQAHTHGAIAVARLSAANNVHWGAGAKRMAAQATTEYHDRFLIELIQNAHDAHGPSDRSGEISILFVREEGDLGTLYVGNTGSPFSESNFLTICEIGLSDKPPGEAIGNKGIGFKSVLQICSRPEIYSTDPAAPVGPRDSFDGFCFSFATREQLLELLGGDEQQFELMRRETATFHLPVPLHDQPDRVKDFARRGFASVIRLPLDRENAIGDVERQLETILTGRCPLLLFLERVHHLAIEVLGEEPPRCVDLFRSSQAEAWTDVPGVEFTRLDLGEQGQYLCASVKIVAEEVAKLVARAVAQQELDERWLAWCEDATVSAAVRLDAPLAGGLLYTYLPTEVPSSFAGHLNAPFYAQIDRRGLNRDLILNSHLLDAGARACRLAAKTIALRNERDLAGAGIDFFAWEPAEAHRLQNALGSHEPALDASVLPIVTESGLGWGSLGEAYVWDDREKRTLTAQAIAKAAHVSILDLDIGADRLSRVQLLYRELLDRGMEPQSEELAGWVESIALAHQSRARGISWWDSFYEELAGVFVGHERHLEGRRILLDEEWEVRAAAGSGEGKNRTGPTVFFQPVRERAEGIIDIDAADDVRIPKTLQQRILFMHPELEWLERVGTTRRKTRSRSFLEESGLVKPYAARALLEHVRDLLNLKESRSHAVYRDSLRLAFRLQRTRDYDQRPALRDLRLRVPCRGGWMPAAEARFSQAWPKTMGTELEHLIDLAVGVSDEITAIERKLLRPPDQWPWRVADPGELATFLSKAGVRDGLWPASSGSSQAELRGWGFQPEALGSQVGLRGTVLSHWVTAVKGDAARPKVQNGYYRSQTPFYVLPGQADYQSLSDHARRDYAALVAASCQSWSDDHFSVSFKRTDVTSYNFDPFSWPTPLGAFLAEEEWVPVAMPQPQGDAAYVRLGDAWHFSGSSSARTEYALPEYAPLLPVPLRRLLDTRPEALRRLRTHGLNVWNEPAEAARLVEHLGRIVRSDGIADQYASQVRRTYRQAWRHAVEAGDGAEAARSDYLVITRGGKLGTFHLDDDPHEILYLSDGVSRLAESLLHLTSLALLDVGMAREVGELLSERLGRRVLAASEERVVVLDDGVAVVPDSSSPLLLAGGLEWMDGLVMAAQELKAGASQRLSERDRESVLRTLRSLRLRFVGEIVLQIGTTTLSPPPAMREAVPLPDDENPTIAVRGGGPELTWDQLEKTLPALADLIVHPETAPALQLAATRLARHGAAPLVAPSMGEIADALDEPEHRVRDVVRSLRGSAAAVLDILAPAIVALSGLEEYERLVASEELDSEEDAYAIVDAIDFGISSEQLRSLVGRAGGVDDLRRGLGISLAEFNEALLSIGRRPISYAEEQANAFAEFVAQHQEATWLELRQAYLSRFRSESDLEAYVLARDGLRQLGPDPAWLAVYELPPETDMETRLREWLNTAIDGTRPAGDRLRPLDAVQRDNRGRVREFLAEVQRIVLAWSQEPGRSAPAIWNRADLESSVWDALLEEGQTDFEPIESGRLLNLLMRRSHWPEGMPLTLSLAELRLTEDDLDRARTEEELESAQREYMRRTIELGGTRYSGALEDLAALAEAARATVSESLLRTKASFSPLAEPVAQRKPRGPGGAGRTRTVRMSDSQRAAVGLVGEAVALEWLKRRYPGASDDSWKSAYRDQVLGGSLGDDSLGYDFEVPVSRTRYFFEVKASTGDQMQIELGESEVQTAQRHSHTDRYRILYIPLVLDPARRAIHVLPNPFAERGRDVYQLSGSGLRYRFRLQAV